MTRRNSVVPRMSSYYWALPLSCGLVRITVVRVIYTVWYVSYHFPMKYEHCSSNWKFETSHFGKTENFSFNLYINFISMKFPTGSAGNCWANAIWTTIFERKRFSKRMSSVRCSQNCESQWIECICQGDFLLVSELCSRCKLQLAITWFSALIESKQKAWWQLSTKAITSIFVARGHQDFHLNVSICKDLR